MMVNDSFPIFTWGIPPASNQSVVRLKQCSGVNRSNSEKTTLGHWYGLVYAFPGVPRRWNRCLPSSWWWKVEGSPLAHCRGRASSSISAEQLGSNVLLGEQLHLLQSQKIIQKVTLHTMCWAGNSIRWRIFYHPGNKKLITVIAAS